MTTEPKLSAGAATPRWQADPILSVERLTMRFGGLVAVGDEFFVALRVIGERVDVFLSDIAASWDYPLARQVLEYLDVPVPDEQELDEILQDEDTALPAGDLSIFADLGLDEMELGILSGDVDLLPDEVLSSIAARLGFSEPFERAIESVFD